MLSAPAHSDQYDAPAGFYDSATGTGSTLKAQLASIMSSGHIQRSYGSFRFSAAISDRDPDNPDNILLVYNRASVDSTWNLNGTLPWNREHVWPQSRQPGSASNSSTGNLGDPHALRPANTQINSDRGSDPFGFAATTGSYGPVGSSWYPGDADRGDIARSLFYSATRYSGLTLVNGTPSGNQMGDLASLIAWHYLDTPDDFERRRNHVIYSQAENPAYYTNNRNAYVDRPEFVHSVFVDNLNDTQLTLDGGNTAADGASTLDLDFGRVIVGAALPAAQNVTLNKTGNDGTYYEVSTSSSAVTSSVTGRNQAFGVGGGGSRTLEIGLGGSTATAGLIAGDVIIDNLDVTDGFGNGYGDRDGNDVISAHLEVLDHSNAAFAIGFDANSQTIDFGTISQGASGINESSAIMNFASAASLTAGLDLDGIQAAGDTDVFSIDLGTFSSLAAGDNVPFSVFLDTTEAGSFSATYTLFTSDEDLPGATNGDTLTLTVLAEIVAAGFIEGDYDGNGSVGQGDLNLVLLNWGQSELPAGWVATEQYDGVQIGQNELNGVLLNWGSSVPPDVSAIPEPASAIFLGLAGLSMLGRRGGFDRRMARLRVQ
ncbi:MAG: endonuclease [Planctomycetota bacterium]